MSRVKGFTRSHTLWLSLAVGIVIIPFAYAQVLGAAGVWNWLSSLHANGGGLAFWVAFYLSRVLFGLAWFVSWRALEDVGIRLGFLQFEDEVFGSLLPTPSFTRWSRTEFLFFTVCILLVNFSVADVAIALYTWAPPPYFG